MSPGIPKKLVGVTGDGRAGEHEVLFAALAGLYPVEFCRASSGHRGLEALLVLDGDLAKGPAAAAEGLPSRGVPSLGRRGGQ